MPAQHRDVSQPSAINDGIIYRPNPSVYEMGMYDLGVDLCLHQLSYFCPKIKGTKPILGWLRFRFFT